jgi:hypothetical protein
VSLVAAAAVFVVAAASGGGSPRVNTSAVAGGATQPSTTFTVPSHRTVASDATTTTPPGPASTTTSTVDPGSLPQTAQQPSGSDPQFVARMASLVQAVAVGRPALATGVFFPLAAYTQVKAISDPAADYQNRLLADFDQDIMSLHSEIDPAGSTASLTSVSVPPAAQWIVPGVEYNKGSYWRVYGSVVHMSVAGAPHFFGIASLISWRGQWYVVHLSSIR